MDRDSIERIRTATFKVGRRGYDKREVDRFLEKLADWLETGGGDDARSEVVRAELERIGEQVAGILTQAHDAAEALRMEFEADIEKEREAAKRYESGLRAEADAYSERTHIEADEYATETRGEADAYAARVRNEANAEAATTREDAEAYAETARREAEEQAAEMLRSAESQAGQAVDDAMRRRGEIEKVIDDLAERRKTVIEDMQRLSTELVGTATEHEGLESTLDAQPGEDTREFSAVDDGAGAEELEDAELSDAEHR
jgi:DivIVA domain-containing protein